ncbi:hypothetical protein L4D15_24155 [Enterovibrio norvegicus]|uniref:hypothetical protein n=1 Tax=Enterovibrio norvegicus TaxID=188144 RepID=UPI003D0E0752
MKTPIELLFKENPVAKISKFGYATPWASAHCEFKDEELGRKLSAVTTMLMYDLELEELGLSEQEEELMWDKKLVELEITSDDLDLDEDALWTVRCDDESVDPVRAIRFYNGGLLEWRA